MDMVPEILVSALSIAEMEVLLWHL